MSDVVAQMAPLLVFAMALASFATPKTAMLIVLALLVYGDKLAPLAFAGAVIGLFVRDVVDYWLDNDHEG